MFEHAGSGYAGNGTLCGALGVSSSLINLVLRDGESFEYTEMITQLMKWYASMEFPTNRFDHLSEYPDQVKAPATTPLCHTSVSNWTVKAGVEVTSKQKYERCAKTAGEVVYATVHFLNEYIYNDWKPSKWEPVGETSKQCLTCHGTESYFTGYNDSNNNQVGRMECTACHTDHMKPLFERVIRHGRLSE